jgi:hypothetical protein
VHVVWWRLLFTRGPHGVVQRSLTTFEPTGRPAIERIDRMALADDGLVVGDDFGRLRVLDAVTLEPASRQLPATAGLINWIRLSEDANRLVVVNSDRTARVADLTEGAFIGRRSTSARR